MIKAEHAGDTCSAFSDVVNFVVGRTQDFAGSAVVVDVPGVRKNDSEHFYTSVGVFYFVVGRTQDFAGSAVVVDVPGVRKNDSEHFYTSVGRC
ncbi:hypothetical protein [Escherichia coli]|uniref:hypothetical protein n=1 Tax=Escherichia coli TaxID=562 RepID=UPI003D81201D